MSDELVRGQVHDFGSRSTQKVSATTSNASFESKRRRLGQIFAVDCNRSGKKSGDFANEICGYVSRCSQPKTRFGIEPSQVLENYM